MNGTSRRLVTGFLGMLGMIATGVTQAAAIDITVVNASTRDVDGLYLAATAQSAWGPDQIEAEVLAQGESVTLRGVGCPSTIVVIAEDIAGCFLYQTVGCGADATWTISNSTARDCGR